MSGFERKILVAQVSIMTSTMPDFRSSSSDCVESTIAALCFRQVLRASTTYRWMLGFLRNTHASSMKNALKTCVIWRSAMTALARWRI